MLPPATVYPHTSISRRRAYFNLSDRRKDGIVEAGRTITRLKKKIRRDEIIDGGLERLDRLEERFDRIMLKDSLNFEVTGRSKFKFSLTNSINDNILSNGEAFLSLRNTTDEVTTITPLVKVFVRMDGFTKEKNLKVPGANFSGDSVDIIVTDIWSNEPYEELTVNLI